MDRRRCETIIKRPLIKQPEIKFDAEELADLKALARELATKVMAAADATGAETRACSSTRIAARRLQNMQPKAQKMALARARKLAQGSETCSHPGLNRGLAARLRKIIQISDYALNSGKSHHHLVKKVRDRR